MATWRSRRLQRARSGEQKQPASLPRRFVVAWLCFLARPLASLPLCDAPMQRVVYSKFGTLESVGQGVLVYHGKVEHALEGERSVLGAGGDVTEDAAMTAALEREAAARTAALARLNENLASDVKTWEAENAAYFAERAALKDKLYAAAVAASAPPPTTAEAATK